MRRASFVIFSLALVVLTRSSGFGQQASGLKSKLEPIVKAQAEAKRHFLEDFVGKTNEAEQKPAVDRFHAELFRNTDQVLELVRAHPTDPAVVEALQFVIVSSGRGPGMQSYQAMEILLRDHVRDPGMGQLCGRIFHFPHAKVAESLLRAVLENHPNVEDRALACHSLAELLNLRGGMIRAIRSGRRTIDEYVHEEFRVDAERLVKETDLARLDRDYEALLERCVYEFGSVKDWFTPGRTVGEMARGELFHQRNLAEGQVIPEITGNDHDGKTFSLSEFRGKVVVLTFSASWCGPCVGMYPQERELVKKLEGRPFSLVSVHSDEDVGKLKSSIASGEITWRCWWDQGVYGPITTRWGILAIPEIYVIDREGVIRKKNVRGEELEKAVMSLLDEPVKESKSK